MTLIPLIMRHIYLRHIRFIEVSTVIKAIKVIKIVEVIIVIGLLLTYLTLLDIALEVSIGGIHCGIHGDSRTNEIAVATFRRGRFCRRQGFSVNNKIIR